MVVVIGNFDGVHLGHRRVLECAAREAEARSQRLTALTFDIHPKTFFRPDCPVKKLLSDEKKKELLLSAGADSVVFQHFTRALADTDAADYLRFLKTEYACDALVCGENFRLGKNAAADAEDLKRLAEPLKMTVKAVPLSYLDDGTPISSTNVRAALGQGQPERAREMLGRWFSMQGVVRHGRQIGRTMSLPTANLTFLDDMLLPKDGVYVSYAFTENAQWQAVTNVGTNPTVACDGKTVVETHLTRCVAGERSLDLYGRRITVVPLAYLRTERRFDGLEELKRQIRTDIQKSDEIFGNFADKNVNF